MQDRADEARRADLFARFVLPEHEVLARVAFALTRNAADAEDLVQETLLSAYRAIERFDGAHPRAWVVTILRNTEAKRHRRRRPQLLRHPDIDLGPPRELPLLSSPEELVVGEELDAVVLQCLRALPERHRQVVELVDLSGLTYAEAGGLVVAEDGRIKVGPTQETSVPGVYALGDVSSPYMLKHVANREARVVAHNLLHPDGPIETDHRVVPHAVFSHPQIGSVGLTEQAARARGVRYVRSIVEYAGIAYGWAMEDTTGFAKLLADPAGGQLLGAHILGPEASTLLQPLVQAMQFGLDAVTMAEDQYWIHPAMTELIENALLRLPVDRPR